MLAYTQTSDDYCGSLLEKLVFVEASSRAVWEYSLEGLGNNIRLIGWAPISDTSTSAEVMAEVTPEAGQSAYK